MNQFTFILATAALVLSACSASKSSSSSNNHIDAETHNSGSTELISQEGPVQITQDNSTDLYNIARSDLDREFTDLHFVQKYFRYYQALNADREIVYFDDSLNVFQEVEDFFWTCGTVPHYTLSVVVEGDYFVIYSDETFFDMSGEEPAVEIDRIPLSEADEVSFINGLMSFNYTSNFAVGREIQLDPQTLILTKGDKLYFYGNLETGYDEIVFSEYSPSLKTIRDGLYGLHNIIEPQFTEIGEFEYFLAPVILPSGNTAVLDVFGEVYE